MIRSVKSIGTDTVLCTSLAQGAVHGSFAGYTGFTVGTIGLKEVYIPVSLLNSLG